MLLQGLAALAESMAHRPSDTPAIQQQLMVNFRKDLKQAQNREVGKLLISLFKICPQ